MSSAYSSNVVSISGRGRDPGQRIIEECRERLGRNLISWLESIAPSIAEELFSLADGTNDRLAQTRYLDLREGVRTKWADMVAAFRNAYIEACNPSGEVSLSVPDFAGLSLVEDDALSENIVIREFAARLMETCNEELYGLDRRVATLLSIEDVEKVDNPLGPEVVCEAVSKSCRALTGKTEERTILLRRLEKHLHQALPGLYQDINQRLVDFGVLPDLKRTYRKASAASTTPGTFAESPATPPFMPSSTATSPGEKSAPVSEGGILSALQKLVALRSGGAAPGHSGASAPASGGGLPDIPFTGVSEAGGGSAPPADGVAVSQAFFASLDQFKQSEGPATVNHIQVIRQSEAARNVGHVEAVTIDIVAMLFDFIFNDEKIPNGVKALVGRLQIPVLKVAMLDQTFFGNRSHPARRFLDEISGIALRWGGNIDTEDPFYSMLAELIERIHNEFAEDVEIFGRALDELQSFVDQREKEEETTTRIAAEVAARREREAAAWERANDAVRAALLEPMPAVMADFFREHWVEVLQRIANRQDDQEQAWQDAVKLMTDLPRSVLPKKSPVERMALISTLPSLLARINKGLDIVNADKNERRPFFDALVDLHTAALKGEPPVAKPAAEMPEPPPAPKPAAGQESGESVQSGVDSNETGDIIVTRSISNGVEVEEITLVGAKPIWRADHRQAAAQVAELKRGDWVEFRNEDGTSARERLTWMSPQRHLLVFSNHRAAKAISIAPDALAKKIREGQAAVVSEESLFERAMNGVMENLKTA